MATITYSCDTCNRDIELIENQSGLTVFNKCIITDGCQGNLFKIDRSPYNVRENIPRIVDDLNEYFPRKKFFEYSQNINSSEWEIRHNLGVHPLVLAYVEIDGKYSELNSDSYEIKNISKNRLKLIFSEKYSGKAQLIARTSVDDISQINLNETEMFNATNNKILTIAIPSLLTKSNTLSENQLPFETRFAPIEIDLVVTFPNKEEEVFCKETLDYTINSESPWVNWPEILVRKRKKYNVRSKSILNFRAFGGTYNRKIDPSEIPEGTRVRIEKINFGDNDFIVPEYKTLLVLLGYDPYDPIDKETKRFLDVSELNNGTKNFLEFRNGEFVVSEEKLERSYPEIEAA